jgi:hypothetical protein|tara:strand:+ start:88 stop:378 length:291 start_codon:yes stop_codon:yes gene_type:complete
MSFSSDLVGRRVELKAHLRPKPVEFGANGEPKDEYGTVTGGDENFTYIQWNDGIRQQVLNTEFFDSFVMFMYCPNNKVTVPYVPERESVNIRFLNH